MNLSKSYAIFVKMLKYIIFLVKSFLGNFYRHLAIFSGHTDYRAKKGGLGGSSFSQNGGQPPIAQSGFFHFLRQRTVY